VLLVSFLVDCDYASGGYLVVMQAFWFGLSLMENGSEPSKFLYYLINMGLVLVSVPLQRRVSIFFRALGVFGISATCLIASSRIRCWCSPAVTEVTVPTTVTRSWRPLTFTLSTAKPFSGLWQVTRSTSPANDSAMGTRGGFSRSFTTIIPEALWLALR